MAKPESKTLDVQALDTFVQGVWDIRIPNQSPMFDPEVLTNGKRVVCVYAACMCACVHSPSPSTSPCTHRRPHSRTRLPGCGSQAAVRMGRSTRCCRPGRTLQCEKKGFVDPGVCGCVRADSGSSKLRCRISIYTYPRPFLGYRHRIPIIALVLLIMTGSED